LLKSINRKTIVALGLFIGLSLKPIIANAQDIVWDKTVEKDKPWTIKFNKEIVFDESTKKEISIKDSKGNTINVNITLGADNKSINVTPGASYIEGETYKLIIGNNIYDRKNIKLKEGSSLTFKMNGAAKTQSDYMTKAIENIVTGYFQTAIENTTKAIEADKNDVDAYIYRAYCYYRIDKNLDAALQDIDKAFALEPNSSRAYSVKAFINMRLMNYQESKLYLSKGTGFTPKNAAEYYMRALNYNLLKQNDKAEADINKVIEMNPKATDAYPFLGYLYEVKGDYETALNYYNKAIEMDPNLGEPYEYRGELYSQLGEYNKALSDLTKSLQLGTTESTAYYFRGAVYYNVRNYTNAVEDFTKSIEIKDKSYDAYLMRGLAYFNLLQYDKSITDLTKAISLNPNRVDAYSARGTAYCVLGKYAEAINDFKVSTSMVDNFYDYDYLGVAYGELGQYENALDAYTTALEIADTDDTISAESISSTFKKRGEIYILLKDLESALSDFDSALYFNENNKEALDYYNFLTDKLNMSI